MHYLNKTPILVLILLISSNIALPVSATIWDPYHTKEEKIQLWMNLWETTAGTEYQSVGKTYLGNEIWMFKAGNPAGARILLDGELHGSEDKGSELLYLLALWLLTSGESEAEEILRNNYILFIPVLNYDSNARGNANHEECKYGVDLNRNFVTGWSRTLPRNDLYSGPSPASEPETQALRRVFETIRPDFYLSMHCGMGPVAFYSLEGNQMTASKIIELVEKNSKSLGITPYSSRGLYSKGYSIGDASSYGASAWMIEIEGSDTAWKHTDEIYQDLVEVYLPKVKVILMSMSQYSTDSDPTPPPPPPSNGGGNPGGGGSGGGGLIVPSPPVISILNPAEAAGLLEDFEAEEVTEILEKVEDSAHVAKILEHFTPSFTEQVLEGMDNESTAGMLLQMMKPDASISVLLELDKNSELLKPLVEYDFNASIHLIEKAVKSKVDGLNETERKSELKPFAATLGSLDIKTLVETLIGVSKLPETPITVAYLMNSMSPLTAIIVASNWIGEYPDEIEHLGVVMDHLDTEALNNLYKGISDQHRETIIPHLTGLTLDRKAQVGYFEVENLRAQPSEVEKNTPITITYEITNTGTLADTYTAILTVNDLVEKINSGFLYPNETEKIQTTLQRDQVNTYKVSVEDETAYFTIKGTPPPPTPANIKITNVEITPKVIIKGDEVTIHVIIENIGEETGCKAFTLTVDGSNIESKEVENLEGGAGSSLTYKFTNTHQPGKHLLTIDDTSIYFNVEESPDETPWSMLFAAILILVGIIVYIYYRATSSPN